jgi:hypothetical protein
VRFTFAAFLTLLVVAACGPAPSPATPLATPAATPQSTPIAAESGPPTDCPPVPSPNPAGLPLLTCAAAVRAAEASLQQGHPDIARIAFGFGDYCVPDTTCGGPVNLVDGWVRFEFADGSEPVVVSLFQDSNRIHVLDVGAPTPEPSYTSFMLTLVNASTIPVKADFATDASGGCQGLYPRQRATVELLLLNPSNGFGIEIYSIDAKLADENFPTPSPIQITIADGKRSGTVVMTSKSVPAGAPGPAPSPDYGCQGG